MVRTIEMVKKWMAGSIENSDRTINDFIIKVKKNPAYALTWSDDTFKAAATKQVYEHLTNLINNHSGTVTIESLSGWVLDDVTFKATCPEHSTSVCSNMIERYELAAKAELLRYLNK